MTRARASDREQLYGAYDAAGLTSDDDGRRAAELFARRYLLPELAGLEAEPLLELGAGCGWTVAALRAAGFGKCRGVDITAAQVEIARRNGIDVDRGDALEALRAAPAASLAAVIALDLLEHFERRELLECVELVASRLSGRGVFIFRVPNGAGLFGGSIRYGDLTHERAFTESSVKQLVATAGFAGVRVEPCRPLVHGAVSAIRYVIWRGVEAAATIANAAESGNPRGGVLTRNLLAIARR